MADDRNRLVHIEGIASPGILGVAINLMEAAEYIGLDAEKLLGLCQSGHAPHYRLDGKGPWFKKQELSRWAKETLVQHWEGSPLPTAMPVLFHAETKQPRQPPKEIASVKSLISVASEAGFSGVYFLCHEGVVVYVGQSVCVAGRLAAHFGSNKLFDAVWAIPIPKQDLDRVEGAFIRILRPTYNISENGRINAPSQNSVNDNETLAMFDTTIK